MCHADRLTKWIKDPSIDILDLYEDWQGSTRVYDIIRPFYKFLSKVFDDYYVNIKILIDEGLIDYKMPEIKKQQAFVAWVEKHKNPNNFMKRSNLLLRSVFFENAFKNRLITDMPQAYNLLEIQKDNLEKIFGIINKKSGLEIDMKAQLALKAIEINLPDLSARSFDEMLEIRYQMKNELAAFRSKMNEITAKIKFDMQPDEIVRTDLQRLVDKYINPEINDLEKHIKYSRNKLVRHSTSSFGKTAITFLGSIYSGVSLEVSALLSLGIFGVDAVNVITDYYEEKQEKQESNGLVYLLKCRKI